MMLHRLRVMIELSEHRHEEFRTYLVLAGEQEIVRRDVVRVRGESAADRIVETACKPMIAVEKLSCYQVDSTTRVGAVCGAEMMRRFSY